MNRNTEEKITVLLASVKEREKSLKLVLGRIYDYVDVIELVLNYYEEIPEWIASKPKIVAHLNQQNKHAHDSIWNFVPSEGYVFVMDDDLLPPKDGELFYKLIEDILRYDKKRIVCMHGSNITLPAGDYMDARATYGFSDRLERDIIVDVAGVGTVAFHSSTLQPSLQDFPVPFCRDIYFSLLCARKGVQIVNVARRSGLLQPLQTPGSTVYEETLSNKRLRALKNRVMKEQLLPSLHCANHDGTGQYVLVTDYGFDKRLLDKTLQTLDGVSDEQTNILVFSNNLKDYSFQAGCADDGYTQVKRKVLTQFVTPDEKSIGIMGSKVLTQFRFILGLPSGSRVISADGDLYFLRDAFAAFDNELEGCDIGVTTRCESWKYPVNGGMIFFRVNDRVKDLLRFMIGQIYKRTWPELVVYEKQFGHDKQANPNSWYVDQNLWCCAHIYKDQIKERFDVTMGDATSRYNYAPHSDGLPEQVAAGKSKLMQAYHSESVAVLHLKSQLKSLLFEGLLP